MVRSPDDDASEKGRKETRKEENRRKKNIEIRTEKGGNEGVKEKTEQIKSLIKAQGKKERMK